VGKSKGKGPPEHLLEREWTMTIEERFAHVAELLDKSAERQAKTDERIDAIAMHLEIVAGTQQANEKAIGVLNQRTIEAMEAIGRLANIAAAHEERIDDLEGQ
jgi:hypothetical protein